MGRLSVDFELKLEPMPGAAIDRTCEQAHNIAKLLNVKVVFVFNGERIVVWPDSDPKEVSATFWNNRGMEH